MRISYTHAEAEEYLKYTRENFDFVRLVQPQDRKVCNFDGVQTDEICHSFWNRRERCENCTSNRAFQTKGRAVKYETVNGNSYLVISKYMEIDGVASIVEMIANITEDFAIDLDMTDTMAPMIDNLNRQLLTDPLTQAYNRRFLDDNFVPSLNCCFDKKVTVNVAIMDIDDFKTVNDTYGHLAGDILLKDVAAFWRTHFDSRVANRERIVARIGGDEFVVVCCGISGDEFRELVGNYYGDMRKICYYEADKSFGFNISIGTASSDDYDSEWSWGDLFSAADNDMYTSKKSDR